MIQNFVDLFHGLFQGVLQFQDIILFLSAGALICVLSTIFKYLFKGSY